MKSLKVKIEEENGKIIIYSDRIDILQKHYTLNLALFTAMSSFANIADEEKGKEKYFIAQKPSIEIVFEENGIMTKDDKDVVYFVVKNALDLLVKDRNLIEVKEKK